MNGGPAATICKANWRCQIHYRSAPTGSRRCSGTGVIVIIRRLRLKCDSTRAETIFSLSAKRTSPFKLEGASVQSTTGSRGVRISGSNAGYTMFRGSVKSTCYPFHSPVFPSLPFSCVTVWRHVSAGLCQCSNVADTFSSTSTSTLLSS